MAVDRKELLSDLKRWVTRFEEDLREQCIENPELEEKLREKYEVAKKAKRTAFPYSHWRNDELTQSAVAWVLSCVFVRFLEDNDLLERPFLAGLGENRDISDGTRATYFQERKTDSDNDYLAHVFREAGKLPGMSDLMDKRHNALWNAAISVDAAKEFIEFWRRIDPDSGALAHEFLDPDWDTRFLGDLYQDLSESARSKYALLQTPDFVEEFILDRTLDPAIETFGLKKVRMIDPTCGSGHFLLGGFRRLMRLWEKAETGLNERELTKNALNAVYGVDINPFAVAIARFRLLLEAWCYCGVKKLRDAPNFKVNLAVGDSLIHGRRFRRFEDDGATDNYFATGDEAFQDELKHFFEVENEADLHAILGQQYHAVVGNPPYITVKDKALNQLYRKRYTSCSGKYALSVPFMERFFDLTDAGCSKKDQPAGFCGQITSNSFMKREMGKILVSEYVPLWDITHVIDTSGAYIPGHNGHRGGTPTCIIFGRNTAPKSGVVRTVMGIKSEPGRPAIPAEGKVWTAISKQIDNSGSESDFVSVANTDRERFYRHPWSIGGGGAAELKTTIDDSAEKTIADIADAVGFMVVPGADDVFLSDTSQTWLRKNINPDILSDFVIGELIRDHVLLGSLSSIFPYDDCPKFLNNESADRHFWRFRVLMQSSVYFGKTKSQRGLDWREYGVVVKDKFKTPHSIVFPFVATHNHFIWSRGGASV